MELHITGIVMHETPQRGSWLACLQIFVDGMPSPQFYLPHKVYCGQDVEISPHNLVLQDVDAGQTCVILCHLDDDKDAVCTTQAADRGKAEFALKGTSGTEQIEFQRLPDSSATAAGKRPWTATVSWELRPTKTTS